jgi:REP-associated tyrosine transposase
LIDGRNVYENYIFRELISAHAAVLACWLPSLLLNGLYTQGFHRRYGTVGHVFQGRLKAILVERESYLLELCRSMVLNPVRTATVSRPEQYRWSSYRATVGIEKAPVLLTRDWV